MFDRRMSRTQCRESLRAEVERRAFRKNIEYMASRKQESAATLGLVEDGQVLIDELFVAEQLSFNGFRYLVTFGC